MERREDLGKGLVPLGCEGERKQELAWARPCLHSDGKMYHLLLQYSKYVNIEKTKHLNIETEPKNLHLEDHRIITSLSSHE